MAVRTPRTAELRLGGTRKPAKSHAPQERRAPARRKCKPGKKPTRGTRTSAELPLGIAGSLGPPEPLRQALLAWFDTHRRDLPWRRTRDPYAIWISEVMLQQTQVATVIPYYRRFLERFPDAASLAGAPLSEVLGMWRGLGYYARARHLHLAAQRVAGEGMPQTSEGLLELPGFGRYTAAAVASIAFGERAAVLDGNVRRVLARLHALEGPLAGSAADARLWAEAEALLDPHRPGAFNEAMMELGATVCLPSSPRCESCPVRAHCAARREGLQESIPEPKVRTARKPLDLACAVVTDGQALLLARRPERGLFGGLWELPCAPMEGADGPEALAKSLGLAVLGPEPLAVISRTLSHRDLRLFLYRCHTPDGPLAGYLEQRYAEGDDARLLGVSTAMVRALETARTFLVG